jgi:hypothetical protein
MSDPTGPRSWRPGVTPAQAYLHQRAPLPSGGREPSNKVTIIVVVVTAVVLACCCLGVIWSLASDELARALRTGGPASRPVIPNMTPSTSLTPTRRPRVGRDVTVEWTRWVHETLGDRVPWTATVTGAHTYVRGYTLAIDTQLADAAADRATALTMCRVAAMWLSSSPYDPEVRTADDVSIQVNSAQAVVLADRRSLGEPCIMRGGR